MIRYDCHAPYSLNTSSGERTCLLSGEWSSGEPACIFPKAILITLVVLGPLLVVVVLAGAAYHFRLEIRVLVANRCVSRSKYKVKKAKCGDVKAFQHHGFFFRREQGHAVQ